MSDYNLGTASGRIEIDGRGAALGFKVAESAAGAFFDVVQLRVKEVQNLGKRMAAVGASGVAGFGLAVKTASAFEKQMSGVAAVANATDEELDKLRETALRLGKDTVFSASEGALAIEELAKAGIPVADILTGAADAAVALAAAGGIGLEEAASIAANAMNAFEVPASKLTKVADVLAGVANTSASDVSGIGQSMSQASAVAHLAGLSFRDTAIAIGEMADAGIKGSDAGTSIKTFLNNLIPVTDKQSSKFKELGLLTYDLGKANKFLAKEGLRTGQSIEQVKNILGKYVEELDMGNEGTVKNAKNVDALLAKNNALNNSFFDSKGNVKDLVGLQATLGKALKDKTKEEKLATLEVLFGADAMRASAILSLAGAKGFREFSKSVRETSAADVAKTRLNNLSGAVESFKGSMDTALITIGSVFIPAITKIVQAVTKVVNVFNNLPHGVQVAIAIIGAIGSVFLLTTGLILAMLPVIATFLVHMLAMRAIAAVTGGFRVFFTTLKAGNGTMAATQAGAVRTGGALQSLTARTLLASKAAVFAGRGFIFLWTAITGPIGIAIAIIAALVGLGILLYKKWAPFRNLVDQIAAFLREKLMAAWEALQPVIKNSLKALQDFGDFIQGVMLPVLKAIGDMLYGKIMKGWEDISSAVQDQLMPAIDELVAVFQGDVVPALQNTWEFLQPLVMGFLKVAGVIAGALLKALYKLGGVFIQYVLPILAKVVGFLLGVVIDAIVELVKGAIQAVKGVIQIFKGLIDFFAGLFTGDWSRMWGGILTILKGILNLIVGAVRVFLQVGLLKLVGLGFKLLIGLVRGSWRLVLVLFKAAGAGIWAIVKAMFRLILAVIRGAFRFAVNIVRGGWRGIQNLFRGALRLIWSIVKGIFRLIVAVIKGQLRLAVSIAKGAWNLLVNLTKAAFNRFFSAIKNIVEKAITFIKELPGKILDAVSGFGSLLYNAGRDLIQGLINGVGDMVGNAVGSVADLGKKMLGGIGGALGLGSPSKITDRYGEWTVQGLQNGAERERRKTVAQMAAMAKALTESFNSNLTLMSPNIMATQNFSALTPPRSGPALPVRDKKKATTLRMVSGTLSIDKNGRAFIRGVAEEVVDGNARYDAGLKRAGIKR